MSDTCQSCTRKFPRIAWLSLASAMTQNLGRSIPTTVFFALPNGATTPPCLAFRPTPFSSRHASWWRKAS